MRRKTFFFHYSLSPLECGTTFRGGLIESRYAGKPGTPYYDDQIKFYILVIFTKWISYTVLPAYTLLQETGLEPNSLSLGNIFLIFLFPMKIFSIGVEQYEGMKVIRSFHLNHFYQLVTHLNMFQKLFIYLNIKDQDVDKTETKTTDITQDEKEGQGQVWEQTKMDVSSSYELNHFLKSS